MYIRETNSTSTLLRQTMTDATPHLFTVRTDYQTAGRGQAGNGWESEDGSNLLFSTLLRYSIPAQQQFRLTEIVSVAMVDMLSRYLPVEKVHIKWPNDIYYEDKKLSGILVENTLAGTDIAYSIVGIGLNVNQLVFNSKAPNPISMKQITGKDYAVETLLDEYLSMLQYEMTVAATALHERYLSCLYRRRGMFPYVEREVSIIPTTIVKSGEQTDNKVFMAEIIGIEPTGELVLRCEDGAVRTYHFKQIQFVI